MGSSTEDSFCLKWNDFHTSVTSTFADLRNEANLFDVTLICEGNVIPAHKLILSACSTVFKQMFRTIGNTKDPVVLLWDIKPDDMELLLNFMYHGEVNITQDKLNHFLELAERLQVRGLTSSGEKEKQRTKNSVQSNVKKSSMMVPSFNNKSSLAGPFPLSSAMPQLPTEPVPQTEILGNDSSSHGKNSKSIQIKDEVGLKSEDDLSTASGTFTPPVITEIHTPGDDGSMDENSQHPMDSSFGDDNACNSNSLTDDDRGGFPSLPSFPLDTLASLQVQSLQQPAGSAQSKDFPCTYCEKRYLTRSRLKRHVLDVHEKGEYPCPDCGKIFSSTRRLKDHQRSRYCHGQQRVAVSSRT